MNIIDNTIYFIVGSPGYVYKLDLDNLQSKKLFHKKVDHLMATDKFLFFREPNDFGEYSRLYRTNLNGKDKKILSKDVSRYVMDNHNIYYSSVDDSNLYSMDLSGENRTKVSDSKILSLGIWDKYIYYSNPDKNYNLYRIEKNGTNEELISTDACWNINIFNNKIYYRKQSEGGNLYVMDLLGKNDRFIAKNNIARINVINEYIMFRRITENSGFYLIDAYGKEIEVS